MKKILFLALMCSTTIFTVHGQIGIGTKTPHPSSILDLTATDGYSTLVLPRLTTADRDTHLKSPSTGLVIYNSTTQGLEVVTSAGVWVNVCKGTTTATANGTTSNTPGVGIGTTTPNANSILDIFSSTKGVLLPRLDDDPSVENSSEGMIYYNTTTNDVKLRTNTSWITLTNQ